MFVKIFNLQTHIQPHKNTHADKKLRAGTQKYESTRNIMNWRRKYNAKSAQNIKPKVGIKSAHNIRSKIQNSQIGMSSPTQ